MTEQSILQRIHVAFCRGARRIFRNNTAQAWVGQLKRYFPSGQPVPQGWVLLENARPLHAGLCKGSSDLIGWTTVEITMDMVGKKLAVFTAIEVKSASGKATSEQVHFIEQARAAGAFAGVARSVDEAEAIISKSLFES